MDEPPPPPLRRRNSIATSVVVTLQPPPSTTKPLHTSSLPPPHINGTIPDLELVALGAPSSLSYTSLKDLLPSSAVNSPCAVASYYGGSAYEISIRNRLVKQAAWAYLQPMASSPSSSTSSFFRRLWLRFSAANPITACFRFVTLRLIPSIFGAFDRILQAIRVFVNR